jgi:hypothetical protein
MIDQITVTGISELADTALKLTERFNTTDIWYRGHACASYTMLPTLIRAGYSPEVEAGLYEEFRIRAVSRHRDFPAGDGSVATAHRMTIMRHYGLPTRVLDWSNSALVAAFFAVGEVRYKCDAVLWALCPQTLNELRINKRGIASLSGGVAYDELLKVLTGQGSTATFAARSPEVDPRMFAQQGSSYTFHGDPMPLEETPDAEKFLVKLVIPSEVRVEFATYLVALGMRLSSIYPDLQNLAREMCATRTADKLLFDPEQIAPCACA